MTAIDYAIVGAEVDETRRYLLPDGTISETAGPGAQPLNVEFIGKLMVELSKLGPTGMTADELRKRAERVKNALRVRDLGGPGAAELSDAEREAILKDTDVTIVFESRTVAPAKTDRNTRVLVVPSDRTLEIAEAGFQTASDIGFEPPLTYDLDRALMWAHLSDPILQIVLGFAQTNPPGWTQGLQDELIAHFTEELRKLTTFNASSGPAHSVLNDIMKSPVRAFHRSVGIYATNMCR